MKMRNKLLLEALERRQMLCGSIHTGVSVLPGLGEKIEVEPHRSGVSPSSASRGNATKLVSPLLSRTPASSGAGSGSLAVPAFNSRPGAPKTLYLDFDGQSSITWGGWAFISSRTTGVTPAYDIDGDTSNFSEQERGNIESIWRSVAHKYSPWKVNVTTVAPPSLAQNVAMKVVIGGNGAWFGRGGGVAVVGGFNNSLVGLGNSTTIAWVWDGQGDGDDPRYIAEAVSHEAGHMVGLNHQSLFENSPVTGAPVMTVEYRPQYIMGLGTRDTPGGRWGLGDHTTYTSSSPSGSPATTRIPGQNDLNKLDATFGRLVDEVANVRTSAFNLPIRGEGFGTSSVLERTDDIDFFQFNRTAGSTIVIDLRIDPLAPMLKPVLEVYNSLGTLVGSAVTTGVYDQRITITPAITSSTVLFVSVKPDSQPPGLYNFGSYELDVSVGATDDDTLATATIFGGLFDIYPTGTRASAILMQTPSGRRVFNGLVSSTDTVDVYAFLLTRNERFSAFLSGTTQPTQLVLARDINGDGSIDLSSSTEVVATSPGSGITNLFVPSRMWNYCYLLVRYQGASPGTTAYNLNVTVDASDNLPKPTGPDFIGVSVRTLDLSQPDRSSSSRTDFINNSDVDAYSVFSLVGTQVRIELSDVTIDTTLEAGYDSNLNQVLDFSEIFLTRSGTSIAPPVIADALPSITNFPLIVKVLTPSLSSGSNYKITMRRIFGPISSAVINDLSSYLPAANLLPAISAFSIAGEGRGGSSGSTISAFDLGIQPPGNLTLQTTSAPDQGQSPLPNTIQLIRDANNNNVADANETVASGVNIQHTVPANNTSKYFLRIFNTTVNPATYAFSLLFRNNNLLNTDGLRIDKPKLLPLGTSGSVSGYVGLNTGGIGDRLADYHRFTLASTQGVFASVDTAFNRPGTGAGSGAAATLNPNVGVQIVRDFNNNNTIEPNEIIAGFKGNGLTASSLDTNLPAGTYFIGIVSTSPERDSSAIHADYKLNYSIGQPQDTTPPVVSAAEYRFEQALIGPLLKFSEDVASSLEPGDIAIERINSQGQIQQGPVPEIVSLMYEPSTLQWFVPLDHTTAPDGLYRLRVLASGVRDAAANPMAQDFTLNFHVLAGDANRDQKVDFNDLVLLARNFNQQDRTYGQGDFNYDNKVDFNDLVLLARNFNKTLLIQPPPPILAVEQKRSRAIDL